MKNDPIIEELHQFREKLAARFNYDVQSLIEYFQAQQGRGNRKVILAPRKLKEPDYEKTEQEKKAA